MLEKIKQLLTNNGAMTVGEMCKKLNCTHGGVEYWFRKNPEVFILVGLKETRGNPAKVIGLAEIHGEAKTPYELRIKPWMIQNKTVLAKGFKTLGAALH